MIDLEGEKYNRFVFTLSHPPPPPKKRTFGKVASLCSRWVVGMLESISQFLILSIDCASCYHPQMNFAKVMFLPLSLSHSVHVVGGGQKVGLHPGGWADPPIGYGIWSTSRWYASCTVFFIHTENKISTPQQRNTQFI